MSPGIRASAAAAAVVVLAVAGEFVGAARRKVLRRDVSEKGMPALQPGQVLVRVRGADGRPIPQAAVAEYVLAAVPFPGGGSRRTFGLGSGYSILAPLEEKGLARWIEVSSPSDTADDPIAFGAVLAGPVPAGADAFEIVLPPERTIGGRIRRGPDPVQGVRVKARLARPPELEAIFFTEPWHGQAVADQEGRFRVGQLGEGLHEVSFDAPPGIAIAAARVESGTTLDLDLAAGRVDTVTVRFEDGRPVHQAGVVVEVPAFPAGRGAPLAKGSTDRNGVVRIHRLDPAEKYRLIVFRPGSSPGNPAEARDWSPSDTPVTLRSQRSVSVRVVDEKGAPHHGVWIEATPAEPGRPSVTGFTGPDGRCTLQGIDSGPLRLTLKDPCSFGGQAPVTVDVGAQESPKPITMARGASLSIHFADGGPWTGSPRAVLRKEGSNDAATGQVRGTVVTWHGLDPGATYAAILLHPDRGLAARREGLRSRAQPLKVSLSPALPIGVTVRWPEGAEGRRVWSYWGDEVAGEGELRPDGGWVIPCLPAGKYVVGASCRVPGSKDPVWTFVEADAGGEAEIRFP